MCKYLVTGVYNFPLLSVKIPEIVIQARNTYVNYWGYTYIFTYISVELCTCFHFLFAEYQDEILVHSMNVVT